MQVLENKNFKTEFQDKCPICDSERSNHSSFARSKDVLLHSDSTIFEYFKCSSCNTVYLWNRPTATTVKFFYGETYTPYGTVLRYPYLFKKLRKLAMRIANQITGLNGVLKEIDLLHRDALSSSGVFLDFGCGAGNLLDNYRMRYGCKTIGMDFNAEMLKRVSLRGHATLPADAWGWSSIPDYSVDLVVMNHVIEHLYQPRGVLCQIHRVLKPNGILDLATPNPAGVSARRFKNAWFALDAPRHVALYEPSLVISLLEQCGFKSIRVFPKPITKDYLRSQARAEEAQYNLPVEQNGFAALKVSKMIRDTSLSGHFDQYHIIARR